MKDCREWVHGQKMIHTRRMCDAMSFLKPIEYMRHERSECGPDGRMFESRAGVGKYSEFDDDAA